MKEKNKGITLVALVVTIIIMLILVAVTVRYGIQSGLLSKAKEGGDKASKEAVREANIDNEMTVEGEKLGDYLNNIGNSSSKKTIIDEYLEEYKKVNAINKSSDSFIIRVRIPEDEEEFSFAIKSLTDDFTVDFGDGCGGTYSDIVFAKNKKNEDEFIKKVAYTNTNEQPKVEKLSNIKLAAMEEPGDYYTINHTYEEAGEYYITILCSNKDIYMIDCSYCEYLQAIVQWGNVYEKIYQDDLDFSYSGLEYIADGIPEGVNSLNSVFSDCYNLIKGPSKLPSTLGTLNFTFLDCDKLENIPEIPANVSSMKWTFKGCESLKGILKINCPSRIRQNLNARLDPLRTNSISEFLEIILLFYVTMKK